MSSCGEQDRKQQRASSVRLPLSSRCTYSSPNRPPCCAREQAENQRANGCERTLRAPRLRTACLRKQVPAVRVESSTDFCQGGFRSKTTTRLLKGKFSDQIKERNIPTHIEDGTDSMGPKRYTMYFHTVTCYGSGRVPKQELSTKTRTQSLRYIDFIHNMTRRRLFFGCP